MYRELEVNKVLVIAPKSVAESTWPYEPEQWSHLSHLKLIDVSGTESQRVRKINTSGDIYCVSRDNTVWIINYLASAEVKFDMLVIDELTSFKNASSKRFKALRKYRSCFSRIVGLTGTPTSEGLEDLWAQVYILDGGQRLGRAISHFRQRYFYRHYSGYSWQLIPGKESEILEKVKDICLIAKTDEVVTLPILTKRVIEVALPADVMAAYKAFERDRIMELEDSDIVAVNAAALTGKLMQFANGAIYREDGDFEEVHSAKIRALVELVDVANEPVLIAYWYQTDKVRLLKALEHFNPRVKSSDADVKDWNSGQLQVMLIHPLSAGHGLNLQYGGRRLIWFSLTHSQELNAQVNKRLHRPGQKQEVIVEYLVVKGTQDERTMAAIESKNEAQNRVVGMVKELILRYRNGK